MTSFNTLVAKGNTPPANTNTLWLSTQKKDLRVAHTPNNRSVVLSGTFQEPDIFYNSSTGLYYLFYATTSSSIGLATSATIDGTFTVLSSTLISSAYHASTYIEGNTVYIYFVDSTTNLNQKVVSFPLNTPLANIVSVFAGLTPVTVFTTTLSGGTLMGNTCVLKIGSVYRMFYEHSYNSISWQIGIAECATPTGTFANKTSELSTLHPTYNLTEPLIGVGGPKVFFENGIYVMYYHGINNTLAPSSDGFLATSLDSITWTIAENGNPILRRCHPLEVDQIGDLCPVDLVGGGTELFYTGCNNPAGAFSIMRVHLSPQFQEFDGNNWRQIIPSVDPLSQNFLRRTSRKTAVYTAVNLDDVPVDPVATVGLVITLPRAAVGSKVRLNHIGTGAGTVAPTAQSGDTFASSGTTTDTTFAKGVTATYECFVQNLWNKV